MGGGSVVVEAERASPVGSLVERGVGRAADEVNRGEVVIGGGKDEAASDLQIADAGRSFLRLGVHWKWRKASRRDGKDACRHHVAEQSGPEARCIAGLISAIRKVCSQGRPVVHPTLLPGIDGFLRYDVYSAAPEYHWRRQDSDRKSVV